MRIDESIGVGIEEVGGHIGVKVIPVQCQRSIILFLKMSWNPMFPLSHHSDTQLIIMVQQLFRILFYLLLDAEILLLLMWGIPVSSSFGGSGHRQGISHIKWERFDVRGIEHRHVGIGHLLLTYYLTFVFAHFHNLVIHVERGISWVPIGCNDIGEHQVIVQGFRFYLWSFLGALLCWKSPEIDHRIGVQSNLVADSNFTPQPFIGQISDEILQMLVARKPEYAYWYLTSIRGKFLLLSMKAMQLCVLGMTLTNIWSFFSYSWFFTFLIAKNARVTLRCACSAGGFWLESHIEFEWCWDSLWLFSRLMALRYCSAKDLIIG